MSFAHGESDADVAGGVGGEVDEHAARGRVGVPQLERRRSAHADPDAGGRRVGHGHRLDGAVVCARSTTSTSTSVQRGWRDAVHRRQRTDHTPTNRTP